MAESNLRQFDAGFRGDLSVADDLRLMLFIRRFEEALLRLFQEGHLNGTTHTCIGQEPIPVSLMPLLRESDYVFSNHRGHGHYLARFLDPEGLMCEILGREGAVCHGVGGSQHIRRGGYFSTGVQGESVPVGVGVGVRLKREAPGSVAVTFIGDGTWGEGSVYEGLNMAALWSVPVVVICENNQIAQSTPLASNMAGSVAGRAAAFGVRYCEIEQSTPAAMREPLSEILNQVRETSEPAVVEVKTRRLSSHSKGDDTRDAAEIEGLKAADWLGDTELLPKSTWEKIDAEVGTAMEALVKTVLARPETTWSCD